MAATLAGAALAVTFTAAPAGAVALYSLDLNADHLVRIDSVTGAVTDVGALGANALDAELALTADGRLWGLNSQFGVRVDLWEIDKNTGAILSSVQVFDGASAVRSAEALGAIGNQLKIGYSPTGDANSNTLANLSAAGAVSGGVAGAVDLDGMANGHANPFGLYATDREPGQDTRLYGVAPATAAATLIGVYSDTLGFHDLVTLPGEAILLDNFGMDLYRVDLSTGAVLGTVALTTSANYGGLALADPIDTVPAPATAAMLLVGLAGLAGAARRRRRAA